MSDRLAEIKARYEAATPDRWIWGINPFGNSYAVYAADKCIASDINLGDAVFAASAHDDIPWLLSELRKSQMQTFDEETAVGALESDVEKLRAENKQLKALINPDFVPIMEACAKLYHAFYTDGEYLDALEELLDAWDQMLG